MVYLVCAPPAVVAMSQYDGTSLCCIAPRLPPHIDGVGDFAARLWRVWGGEDAPPEWTFLVGEGAESSAAHLGARVLGFTGDADLSAALEKADRRLALLHYVGYGFDRRGRPLRLVRALRDWRLKDPARRLIVMFHETWASGRPWQKAFWDQPAQKRCAAVLLEAADLSVTSNTATLRDLRSLGGGRQIEVIPLGPSLSVTPARRRDWRRLLILGRAGSRARAVRTHRDLIARLTGSGLVDTVVLSGELGEEPDPSLTLLRTICPDAIECHFNFPPDALPAAVAECGLSLMHTESTCLMKSTSLHIAAHLGQVPVCLREEDPGEILIGGQHYLWYRRGHPEEVISALSDETRLAAMSAAVESVGRGPLSWDSIGAHWRRVVEALA